jgi:predicted kinase
MQKFLIIIDGPMGSGKTTIGKLLHQRLRRTVRLSTDRIKFFLSDFERGERDNTITAAVLFEMCKEYVNHDINLLLPQAFWKKEYLEPYIKLADENDLKLFIYQLEAPKDVLLERVRNRPKPELAMTPVPEERIQANLKTWEENRYEMGKTFNTSEFTPEEIVEKILKDVE